MPEGYVHTHIAELAIAKAGVIIEDKAAYLWGAQGPDPLSSYKRFSRDSKAYLRTICDTLHTMNTGEFLSELLTTADTPVKKSYVKGFITHYIADTTLHPYIESQIMPGERFDKKYGHGFCESSIDSYIHLLQVGTPKVNGKHTSPKLNDEKYIQICKLLSNSIKNVYNIDAKPLDIREAFTATSFYRRHILCGNGLVRWLADIVEKRIINDEGSILCHFTPAEQPRHGYASEWKNPFTGKHSHKSIHELITDASEHSRYILLLVQKYFGGKLHLNKILCELGSLNYITALPCYTDMSSDKKLVNEVS